MCIWSWAKNCFMKVLFRKVHWNNTQSIPKCEYLCCKNKFIIDNSFTQKIKWAWYLLLILTMNIFGLINSGFFTEDYYDLFLGFTESLIPGTISFSKRLKGWVLPKILLKGSQSMLIFFHFFGEKSLHQQKHSKLNPSTCLTHKYWIMYPHFNPPALSDVKNVSPVNFMSGLIFYISII